MTTETLIKKQSKYLNGNYTFVTLTVNGDNFMEVPITTDSIETLYQDTFIKSQFNIYSDIAINNICDELHIYNCNTREEKEFQILKNLYPIENFEFVIWNMFNYDNIYSIIYNNKEYKVIQSINDNDMDNIIFSDNLQLNILTICKLIKNKELELIFR